MFDKLDYSMKMMAREIEGLEFVEGKYLLDPNDPKAFNSICLLYTSDAADD